MSTNKDAHPTIAHAQAETRRLKLPRLSQLLEVASQMVDQMPDARACTVMIDVGADRRTLIFPIKLGGLLAFLPLI